MNHQEEIAESWLDRSKQTEDPFARFTFLWFGFNALYSQSEANRERSAIRDFIHRQKIRFGQDFMSDVLESNAVGFFKDRVVRDARGNGEDTAEYAVHLKSSEWSVDKRFRSLLMILYLVRCNLFHGSKTFVRDCDQEVVERAAVLVALIMEKYFRSFENR